MSDMNTGAAAPQAERERFEAWYTRFHKHAPLFKRDEEGTYLSPREDVAWKSWLGRAALPAQAVARSESNE